MSKTLNHLVIISLFVLISTFLVWLPHILTLPNFLLTVIDYRVAKTAAFLRAKYNIRLPDALQIAAALTNQAKIFVTNDIQLKVVKDLKIACLSDYI